MDDTPEPLAQGACLQVLRLGRLLQALRFGLEALRLHDRLHHDWVRLCMLAVHMQLVGMRLRSHATQQSDSPL